MQTVVSGSTGSGAVLTHASPVHVAVQPSAAVHLFVSSCLLALERAVSVRVPVVTWSGIWSVAASVPSGQHRLERRNTWLPGASLTSVVPSTRHARPLSGPERQTPVSPSVSPEHCGQTMLGGATHLGGERESQVDGARRRDPRSRDRPS